MPYQTVLLPPKLRPPTIPYSTRICSANPRRPPHLTTNSVKLVTLLRHHYQPLQNQIWSKSATRFPSYSTLQARETNTQAAVRTIRMNSSSVVMYIKTFKHRSVGDWCLFAVGSSSFYWHWGRVWTVSANTLLQKRRLQVLDDKIWVISLPARRLIHGVSRRSSYCAELEVGRDSSDGIATCYRLDGPRIEPRWERDFPHLSRPAVKHTQPPTLWASDLSQG